MKTIFKFGYKIDSDSTKWISEISSIIKFDVNLIECISIYDTNEKNWYETFLKITNMTDLMTFDGKKIYKAMPNFNRYQEYVYLTIVFEENSEVQNSSYFIGFREQVSNLVKNYIDNFEIPFKETDLYNKLEKNAFYSEKVKLGNPTFVMDDFNSDKLKVQNESKFKICYEYKYLDQKNSQYIRVLNQWYITDNLENIDSIIEHFHSVFILFHRSYNFYRELTLIDNPSYVIASLSGKLNTIWPKERVNLFLLNRFINAGLYNKTFFGVLELNAQMNSILSQLKIKHQIVKDNYDKQFERVIYNFKIDNLELNPYYNELLKYLYSPYEHRKRMLNRIQEFFEPTDIQIERLRNDNDSKVSFAIQWIMSILSVIVFFWGIVTVWYENTIDSNIQITDYFFSGLTLMPAYLSIIILTTLMCAISAVLYFLVHNSSVMTKTIKNVIKNKKVDVFTVSHFIDKINNLPKWKCKRKLYLITETFKLITTHVILNFDEDCSDARELINQIERLKT